MYILCFVLIKNTFLISNDVNTFDPPNKGVKINIKGVNFSIFLI